MEHLSPDYLHADGVVSGLLGALFNSLNVNLTRYRMKYLQQRSYHGFYRYVHVHV